MKWVQVQEFLTDFELCPASIAKSAASTVFEAAVTPEASASGTQPLPQQQLGFQQFLWFLAHLAAKVRTHRTRRVDRVVQVRARVLAANFSVLLPPLLLLCVPQCRASVCLSLCLCVACVGACVRGCVGASEQLLSLFQVMDSSGAKQRLRNSRGVHHVVREFSLAPPSPAAMRRASHAQQHLRARQQVRQDQRQQRSHTPASLAAGDHDQEPRSHGAPAPLAPRAADRSPARQASPTATDGSPPAQPLSSPPPLPPLPLTQVVTWLQCTRCHKLRSVPLSALAAAKVARQSANGNWVCELNTWDEARASCDVEEEEQHTS